MTLAANQAGWNSIWETNLSDGKSKRVESISDIVFALNERRLAVGKSTILLDEAFRGNFQLYDIHYVMRTIHDAITDLFPYYVNKVDHDGEWDGLSAGTIPGWTESTILSGLTEDERIEPDPFFNPMITSAYQRWAVQSVELLERMVWAKGIFTYLNQYEDGSMRFGMPSTQYGIDASYAYVQQWYNDPYYNRPIINDDNMLYSYRLGPGSAYIWGKNTTGIKLFVGSRDALPVYYSNASAIDDLYGSTSGIVSNPILYMVPGVGNVPVNQESLDIDLETACTIGGPSQEVLVAFLGSSSRRYSRFCDPFNRTNGYGKYLKHSNDGSLVGSIEMLPLSAMTPLIPELSSWQCAILGYSFPYGGVDWLGDTRNPSTGITSRPSTYVNPIDNSTYGVRWKYCPCVEKYDNGTGFKYVMR